MLSTLEHLLPSQFPALTRHAMHTVQANLGYLCNQQCLHCHVNAGPKRTELMSRATMQAMLDFIDRAGIKTLDMTGGAPEMNPDFYWLVKQARARDMQIIDRCNLTILFEPGYEGLAEFLAEQRVDIVASLPCYLEENVDKQRGKGVFNKSINGLQRLNQLGYGSDLPLNLVFNPQGPELPPPQVALEADYRRFLQNRFGIVFNHLLSLANMPIKRFGSMLLSKGLFHSYLDVLKSAHHADNLHTVMCRSLISIDYTGRVFDCDFNQMLDLPIEHEQAGLSIAEVELDTLQRIPIRTADHCWACTAGQGSSCGGALSDA